jgi:N-succinyldiaminopimelate aminotransferase
VSGAPFQPAIATALRLPDSYFTNFTADLRAKRDLLTDGLRAAGLTVYQPQGTYFITTDLRGLGETDGMAFCRALPDRVGVVAIPAVVLYDDIVEGSPLVRFAYCKRREVLDDAIVRLGKL